MRASFIALLLVGCAGAPSPESSQHAGSGVAAQPSAQASQLTAQRLDPVQLASDWGRPDLVDEIRMMTDEANATLDVDERAMLLRAIHPQLAAQ